MPTSSFITTLNGQLAILSERVRACGHHNAIQSRFDHNLFQSRGTGLTDYLSEANRTLQQLTLAAEHERAEQVAWLAQRLADQMTALARELATLELRRQPAPASAPKNIYAKLAENQDYERRLIALIRDRESLLQDSDAMTRKQQLQREIAALEGRLKRCRQALSRIEYHIEHRENDLNAG